MINSFEDYIHIHNFFLIYKVEIIIFFQHLKQNKEKNTLQLYTFAGLLEGVK